MSQEDAQPEYLAYMMSSRQTPLYQVIQELYPWVSEEDALVIARDAQLEAATLIYQDAMLLKYR